MRGKPLKKKGNNMTHITKLTEIVDGRLLPSDKKLSASLLEVDAGRLTVSGDTLGFDETGLATETYVTNAIAAAQLNGGEVDLSGYATKVDLLTKVDNVEGKGLSTNDYTDADKAKVDGIDTSISTAVNAAITVVVDGAPTTFDTLREIAEWIENDGVAATDLASAIAGKADRTELSDYAKVSAMTQLEGQVSDGLSNKVDKEAGKGLSTNDFTNELKDKLIHSKSSYVDRYDDSISVVHVEEEEDSVNFRIDTPGVERQMQINPKEFMSRSTVNSVPLYSLDNDGKFVLTEPDSWVSFGDSKFVFPVYHLSTVDSTYLKGIVTLSAELGQDEENNPTIDFNYTHNVKDVIDGYVLYVNVMSLTLDENVFPHTFTSSVEGETVFGTIKVPLTYSASGVSFQQAIDLQETRGFILSFGLTLKSGGKGTVQVMAFGTTP